MSYLLLVVSQAAPSLGAEPLTHFLRSAFPPSHTYVWLIYNNAVSAAASLLLRDSGRCFAADRCPRRISKCGCIVLLGGACSVIFRRLSFVSPTSQKISLGCDVPPPFCAISRTTSCSCLSSLLVSLILTSPRVAQNTGSFAFAPVVSGWSSF